MNIAANFEDIQKDIRKAERSAGREEGAVKLLAVTKTQSAVNIEAALATGHRLFGENKVQEAQAHWTGLKKKYPDIELHLIGPLQTNKVKDAVALFDCIETLDREKLADALAAEMKKQGRALPCFVQVNTGEEDQKAGIAPRNLPAFLSYCKNLELNVAGLMCIPPVDEPAGLHFALLKNLAGKHGLQELSMGMSGDFEKAIAAGATFVRVGTALFGERN
jgi:pyridoxal phosphate enzyme (YggS family)